MRKRELGLLWLAVTGVLLAFASSEARACSCLPPPPPAEALASSAAVFEGELREDRLTAGEVARVMEFLVLRAWKGVAAGEVVQVTTGASSAACGHDAARPPGLRMLIYANRNEGALTTGLCTRTATVADAANDLAALGPATSVDVPAAATDASPSPQPADASCGRGGEGCADANSSLDAGSANGALPGEKDSTQGGCAVGSARSAFWLAPVLIVGLVAALRRRRRSQN